MTTDSTARVGLLICGNLSECITAKYGDYKDLYVDFLNQSDHKFTFQKYSIFEGEIPPSPYECDAWLISGSRSSAYDEEPWIESLKTFIRTCAEKKVTLLGICFGHQLIAEALGGKVHLAPNGWGLGVHEYNSVFQSCPLRLNAVHQDQIQTMAKDSLCYAQSQFCPYGGVVYPGFGLSIQLHPEFSQNFVVDLIKVRSGVTFSKEVGRRALEDLQEPVNYHIPETARLFGRFIHDRDTVSRELVACCQEQTVFSSPSI